MKSERVDKPPYKFGKTIYYIISVLMVVGMLLYSEYDKCDCECFIRRELPHDDYQAKVIYTYYGQKHEQMVVLDDSREIYLHNDSIFKQLQKHDLLIKYPGSLKQWWVHHSDTVLFYPTCYKNGKVVEIKDRTQSR